MTLRSVVMVAPPWYPVPPTRYGGIEGMVADLAVGLDALGHVVQVVTVGDSQVDLPRVITSDEGQSARLGQALPEIRHLALARKHVLDARPDLVHDHTLSGPLLAAGLPCPMLHTVHGRPLGEYGDFLEALGDSIGLVAISHAQRRLAPHLNWVATVPNGIKTDSFPFSAEKDDHVVFLGRLCPEKAPHLAIDVARRAGRRIELIGRCAEPAERAYFEAEVAPRLGDDAVYVGEVDHAEKLERLTRASALVFPLQWEEPFGLVLVEAMACGTPVVALARGAVPEVVDHGSTGFVVDDLDQMVDCLQRVSTLSAHDCRAAVAARFDVTTMARGYAAAYDAVIGSELSLGLVGSSG